MLISNQNVYAIILAVSLVRQIIDVAGREIPVNTQLVLLGEEANIP